MDIAQMMQQAKAMQDKMQDMQAKMADVEVEGSAGGGIVKAVVTCKGECRSIVIDEAAIKPEEKEMLEDLIKAAVNDAKSKSDEKLAEETQKMMKELGIPPGVQLPL